MPEAGVAEEAGDADEDVFLEDLELVGAQLQVADVVGEGFKRSSTMRRLMRRRMVSGLYWRRSRPETVRSICRMRAKLCMSVSGRAGSAMARTSGRANWAASRCSSSPISRGGMTRSTWSAAMELRGMLLCCAVSGDWTSEKPPSLLMAFRPEAPSPSAPERTTPTA